MLHMLLASLEFISLFEKADHGNAIYHDFLCACVCMRLPNGH